jgi:hypothetical protein
MLIRKVEVLKIYIGKQVSSYCKFNNDKVKQKQNKLGLSCANLNSRWG